MKLSMRLLDRLRLEAYAASKEALKREPTEEEVEEMFKALAEEAKGRAYDQAESEMKQGDQEI